MTGTGALVRLILRRDRVLLPIWVVIVGLLPVTYVSSFQGLFPTLADRQEYAHVSMTNAGFVALYGRLSGASLGELSAWRAGFIPVVIALLSILTLIRHTRTDEEAGRTELLGAAVIGRHASLAAALIVTGAADVLIGLIVSATMAGQGQPAAGSLAFGAEFAISGWAFAGVAAICAQLTSGARAARGIAVASLLVAWLLRLAGDVSAIGDGAVGWLAWVTPIGWVQHIFPYGGNHWYPVVLTVLFAVITGAAGVVLLGRRDVGAGLLPDRLGPSSAAPRLRSPVALAWRLHRGLLAGWAAGFAALGLIFGGVSQSVAQLSGDSHNLTEIFSRLGGRSALINSYFAGCAGILGIIAAGYAIQATLRMRDEETTGHAEVLLTDAVGRRRWAAGHLLFALLGPAVVLVVAGLLEAVTYGLISHDPHKAAAVLGSVLAQLPAVWVMAAIAVALVGLRPRLSAVSWGALAMSLLILLAGTTLQAGQYVLDVSPFTHIPHLPGGAARPLPFIVLLVIALALIATGLTALRRRDIPA